MNIDRIAREMVDIEPSVDLEARIRARLRLNESRPRRTAAWWTWRVGVPVAAVTALALIVGVQLFRSLPAVAAPAGAVAHAGLPAVAAPAKAGPEVVNTSQLSKVATARVSKIPASQLSRTSQLSSEELAWMERRLPPLDPMNSLQVDRLRVDSIQPEPLGITPLTMSPVATESGGIERRNDR